MISSVLCKVIKAIPKGLTLLEIRFLKCYLSSQRADSYLRSGITKMKLKGLKISKAEARYFKSLTTLHMYTEIQKQLKKQRQN